MPRTKPDILGIANLLLVDKASDYVRFNGMCSSFSQRALGSWRTAFLSAEATNTRTTVLGFAISKYYP
eukprot:3777302-Amphidinium_carterae.1